MENNAKTTRKARRPRAADECSCRRKLDQEALDAGKRTCTPCREASIRSKGLARARAKAAKAEAPALTLVPEVEPEPELAPCTTCKGPRTDAARKTCEDCRAKDRARKAAKRAAS